MDRLPLSIPKLYIIKILLIDLPTQLFQILFTLLSITITLSFSYGAIFNTLLISSILGFFLFRYKFLTSYSKLPKPEPIESPSEGFDLHPDIVFEDETDIHPEFKSYPNDFFQSFLKSIKIFGYLEEPVLDELTRYLNTQRLVAGDILFQQNQHMGSIILLMMSMALKNTPLTEVKAMKRSKIKEKDLLWHIRLF